MHNKEGEFLKGLEAFRHPSTSIYLIKDYQACKMVMYHYARSTRHFGLEVGFGGSPVDISYFTGLNKHPWLIAEYDDMSFTYFKDSLSVYSSRIPHHTTIIALKIFMEHNFQQKASVLLYRNPNHSTFASSVLPKRLLRRGQRLIFTVTPPHAGEISTYQHSLENLGYGKNPLEAIYQIPSGWFDTHNHQGPKAYIMDITH